MLAAWEKVTKPIDLGGLGITNLQVMGWALQMRWLWLNKTEEGRPWSGLDIPIQPQVQAMFAISVTTYVGSGTNHIWTDSWLHEVLYLILLQQYCLCVQKIHNDS